MDEESIKDKLLKRIADSSLSNEDKEFWQTSLENAPQEVQMALLGFFVDFPDNMTEATQFLRKKTEFLLQKFRKLFCVLIHCRFNLKKA